MSGNGLGGHGAGCPPPPPGLQHSKQIARPRFKSEETRPLVSPRGTPGGPRPPPPAPLAPREAGGAGRAPASRGRGGEGRRGEAGQPGPAGGAGFPGRSRRPRSGCGATRTRAPSRAHRGCAGLGGAGEVPGAARLRGSEAGCRFRLPAAGSRATPGGPPARRDPGGGGGRGLPSSPGSPGASQHGCRHPLRCGGCASQAHSGCLGHRPPHPGHHRRHDVLVAVPGHGGHPLPHADPPCPQWGRLRPWQAGRGGRPGCPSPRLCVEEPREGLGGWTWASGLILRLTECVKLVK